MKALQVRLNGDKSENVPNLRKGITPFELKNKS